MSFHEKFQMSGSYTGMIRKQTRVLKIGKKINTFFLVQLVKACNGLFYTYCVLDNP